MSISPTLFSSAKEDWETPQAFFDELNAKFGFTLDPCATQQNAKCAHFYTKEENGLLQSWGGHRVFCNPPYGRKIAAWVEKCYREAQKSGTLVVALLPARTDTRWYHDYIQGKATVRFVRGRLHFGGSKNAAPFPSMIVLWW